MTVYIVLAFVCLLWVITEVRLCRIKILNQEVNTKFPAFKKLVHKTLDDLGIVNNVIPNRLSILVDHVKQLRKHNKSLLEKVEESEKRVADANEAHKRVEEGNKALVRQLQEKIDKKDLEVKDAWKEANRRLYFYQEANKRIENWNRILKETESRVNNNPHSYGQVPDDFGEVK